MVNWLQAKYVSIFEDGLGVMKVYRQGPQGLGMSLDFSHKRQCCVTMYDYLDAGWNPTSILCSREGAR
jgi:hypothetical protein